jgi:hypothetical protein
MASKKDKLVSLMTNQKKETVSEKTVVKKHINAKIDETIIKKMKIHCVEKDLQIQDFLAVAILEKIEKG